MKLNLTPEEYSAKAKALFEQGYNCAQAVFLAFEDITNIDIKTAAALSSSFGGGMGRLREVCGAVSGMLMIAGLLYGYDVPEEGEHRGACYAMTRELCDAFKERNSSIICREILGARAEVGGNPEVRTEQFYKTRPCVKSVRDAAEVLDAYVAAHPKAGTACTLLPPIAAI